MTSTWAAGTTQLQDLRPNPSLVFRAKGLGSKGLGLRGRGPGTAGRLYLNNDQQEKCYHLYGYKPLHGSSFTF